MDGRGRTFLLLQVFFSFFVFASTEDTKQNCSQVQCPGPLIFYHDMGCTPVYRNQGDCCAYKYNCDHLYTRSPNKCYMKHRSYEIGESANREDINICDIGCTCLANRNSTGFWCYTREYEYSSSIGPRCYLKRNIHECGPETVTCVKNESEVPRCVVDGRTYRGGELFTPIEDRRKLCMCQEGYTGDNIEPFCTTMSTICLLLAYPSEEIVNKNAPVFHENPAADCLVSWRRQNTHDTVIPNPNGPTASVENSSGEEDLTCKFGNLTMNIGDELSRNGDYPTRCISCICEVPPTPTCKRKSFECIKRHMYPFV